MKITAKCGKCGEVFSRASAIDQPGPTARVYSIYLDWLSTHRHEAGVQDFQPKQRKKPGPKPKTQPETEPETQQEEAT